MPKTFDNQTKIVCPKSEHFYVTFKHGAKPHCSHKPGLFCNPILSSFLQVVAKEGAEQGGVSMLGQLEQVADVELKVTGELKRKKLHFIINYYLI